MVNVSSLESNDKCDGRKEGWKNGFASRIRRRGYCKDNRGSLYGFSSEILKCGGKDEENKLMCYGLDRVRFLSSSSSSVDQDKGSHNTSQMKLDERGLDQTLHTEHLKERNKYEPSFVKRMSSKLQEYVVQSNDSLNLDKDNENIPQHQLQFRTKKELAMIVKAMSGIFAIRNGNYISNHDYGLKRLNGDEIFLATKELMRRLRVGIKNGIIWVSIGFIYLTFYTSTKVLIRI